MGISRFKEEEKKKRFLWFVRGCIDSTHEQYHRKYDKKKSEREKRKHASMLKILDNLINQLLFPLNTLSTNIFKLFLVLVVVLGLLVVIGLLVSLVN